MIWFITCFAVIFAMLGGWSWLIAPQMDKKPDFTALSGFDYAHRGLHKLSDGVPENCLTGFKLAEESGYGMEFDLQLTKDKKVVVHHDATLLRSCGDDVAIADLTYAELRRYRLFGTDEHIPLFSEVLGILKGQTPLIIELKSYNDPAELCELAMEELEGYKGHYCVESFDPKKGKLSEHINAQLQYELLSCKDSRRRYGFTGAPRDLRGAVISLDACGELAAA